MEEIPPKSSTLITRMTSDVNQAQNGVNLVLRLFLRSPFIVFGAMVMAFTIDVSPALVFVMTIPPLSVAAFIMLVSIPLCKKSTGWHSMPSAGHHQREPDRKQSQSVHSTRSRMRLYSSTKTMRR